MDVDPAPAAKRRRTGGGSAVAAILTKEGAEPEQRRCCAASCAGAGCEHCSALGRLTPLAVLLRRARRRARGGGATVFVPLVARLLHAVCGCGSAALYAQARADLERRAEELGRVEQGDAWRDAFLDELREYRLHELDEANWFQIFIKDRRTVTLTVHPELTIANMLERLQAKVGARLRGGQLKYAGFGLWDEERALWEYGVQRETTIYCCGGFF